MNAETKRLAWVGKLRGRKAGRRTTVGDLVGVVEGLGDVGEVRPERELVDDVREVHHCYHI